MSRSPSRQNRTTGPSSPWVLGLLFLLVSVTLWVPVTSAHTYRVPFTHFTETSYAMIRQISGCGTSKSTDPSFNGNSGLGTWSGRAAAASCNATLGKVGTSNLGEASGAAEVAVAIHVPLGAASTTTIAVTWNFTASGAAKLTINRPCPTPVLVNGSGTSICVAQAVAVVIGDAWLVDLTNGTTTMAYNSPISLGEYNTSENTTTCNPNCTSGTYAFAGGAAFSGAQTATFDISAITNHTHRYALVTYLGGTITTEMQGFGGHATGFVNMKSTGNRFQLVSIVVK